MATSTRWNTSQRLRFNCASIMFSVSKPSLRSSASGVWPLFRQVQLTLAGTRPVCKPLVQLSIDLLLAIADQEVGPILEPHPFRILREAIRRELHASIDPCMLMHHQTPTSCVGLLCASLSTQW